MRAMIATDKAVEIEVTGERVVLRDGQPCVYRSLSPEEQRYYDRCADALYDLPLFDGEFIRTSYNKFTASAPARLADEKTYHVLPEHQDAWYGGLSTEEIGDAIVTEFEIQRLAREWGRTMDELMEEVEEI